MSALWPLYFLHQMNIYLFMNDEPHLLRCFSYRQNQHVSVFAHWSDKKKITEETFDVSDINYLVKAKKQAVVCSGCWVDVLKEQLLLQHVTVWAHVQLQDDSDEKDQRRIDTLISQWTHSASHLIKVPSWICTVSVEDSEADALIRQWPDQKHCALTELTVMNFTSSILYSTVLPQKEPVLSSC